MSTESSHVTVNGFEFRIDLDVQALYNLMRSCLNTAVLSLSMKFINSWNSQTGLMVESIFREMKFYMPPGNRILNIRI
jgi:hypothetical protein